MSFQSLFSHFEGCNAYSSIASSAVADDMPSLGFSQLPCFRRSIERSYRLRWVLERRVLSIHQRLGNDRRNRDFLSSRFQLATECSLEHVAYHSLALSAADIQRHWRQGLFCYLIL